jgi:hypothetical protein
MHERDLIGSCTSAFLVVVDANLWFDAVSYFRSSLTFVAHLEPLQALRMT